MVVLTCSLGTDKLYYPNAFKGVDVDNESARIAAFNKFGHDLARARKFIRERREEPE